MNASLMLYGLIACLFVQIAAQTAPPESEVRSEPARRGGPPQGPMRTNVPSHRVDVLLSRPEPESISLSVLSSETVEARAGWREASSSAPLRYTPPQRIQAGEPVLMRMDGLAVDRAYEYALEALSEGQTEARLLAAGRFHTPRPAGRPFVFTVQADSHLDARIDPEVYLRSLTNVVRAHPDFHVDLGDTFMTDKYPHFTHATGQYLAQRYYFGIVGSVAPVFLVLGNHDGETPGRGRDEMAVWSNGMRKRYFPNPVPDAFYSGNVEAHPRCGQLENYYAFEWGNALFVMLDPYWFSTPVRREGGSNWNRSLGGDQYRWLQGVLERSHAALKFVFIHNLVGGSTPEGRGGAEASRYFEWGGLELDGRDSFAEHRPGWPLPIHALLVKHRVNVVFHGHDHLYARQQRDGMIYQLTPQPGHSRVDQTRSAAEYGYLSGVIQGASGILRVRVEDRTATIEYVRAYPPALEGTGKRTGEVTDRYQVGPGVPVSSVPR